MGNYDLGSLPLIARGGEADIYDLGDGTILRVLRNPKGRSFRTEKSLFPLLREHDICIPAVHAYIETENMTAMTMQKITGITMLEHLKRHPLQMVSGIKRFAGMHAQLLSIHASHELDSIYDRVDYLTSLEPLLDAKLIDFALHLLGELPNDAYICHGDFHPGNILIKDHAYYIIDWGAAYRSNYVSDIAHTYLLMTNVPIIPGQSRIQHALISFMGLLMAKTYLKQIVKWKKFSLADFSKWTVIMALKRVYYGLPSERSARIKYINRCYEQSLKGIDAAAWYRYL